MKKLNRKLIPAFAMLLLSAVLMSTASFAWFSSNGKVTASGLSISATAPAALWISTDGTTFASTAAFNDASKTEISPVTDDLSSDNNTAEKAAAWAFHKLTPEGQALVDKAGKVNGAFINATTIKIDNKDVEIATADTENFIAEGFKLRLEGANDGTRAGSDTAIVSVKVTVDKVGEAAADNIWKCLRVAVVVPATTNGLLSTGGYAIFEPTTLGSVITNPTSGSANVIDIVAQETVDAYVYVWFEGNDTDCTNNNSTKLTNYSVALEFAVVSSTDSSTPATPAVCEHEYVGGVCTKCGEDQTVAG